MEPMIKTKKEAMIENAYISLELEAPVLAPIRERIKEKMAQWQVEVPLRDAHISLGYTIGCEREERLAALLRIIARRQIEFRISGVEVLEGLTTPYDYIVLTLEEPDEFCQARQHVEANCKVKRFAGGFKLHVTLLQVAKGSVPFNSREPVRRSLEEATKPLCQEAKIRGQSVAVFDQQCRCRLECSLSRAA